MISPPIRELVIQQSANDCFMKNMRKTGMGRFGLSQLYYLTGSS